MRGPIQKCSREPKASQRGPKWCQREPKRAERAHGWCGSLVVESTTGGDKSTGGRFYHRARSAGRAARRYLRLKRLVFVFGSL